MTSGMILLICALSYGLIKVPLRAWEERNLAILLGYHLFKVKTFSDLKQKSLENLETQFEVGNSNRDFENDKGELHEELRYLRHEPEPSRENHQRNPATPQIKVQPTLNKAIASESETEVHQIPDCPHAFDGRIPSRVQGCVVGL